MFNFITGKIVSTENNLLVLESNGIGFEMIVSSHCASELGEYGDIVKVYTYLNVREDDISLFGFFDKLEKSLFQKLISVSGIGAKSAMVILSSARMGDIINAICSANATELSRIKGIGKKTAERMILELKDKFGDEFSRIGAKTSTMSDIVPTNDDAVEALMSLGYTKSEASVAVAKVEKDGMSTEQIIMLALKG